MRRLHQDAVNESVRRKAKSSFAAPPCYTAGELVWFLKSMRMCRFVSNDGNNLCTVEVLDSGKRMTATLDGIEPCNVKLCGGATKGQDHE